MIERRVVAVVSLPAILRRISVCFIRDNFSSDQKCRTCYQAVAENIKVGEPCGIFLLLAAEPS